MKREMQSRLDSFNDKLNDQRNVVAKRKKAVDRAKQKLDIEEDAYHSLLFERDLALVESWGNTPDWSVLLDNCDIYSSYIFDLGTSGIERLSLTLLGIDPESNQRCVHFRFESNSYSELQQIRAGIEFISKYIKPNRDGLKSIVASHNNLSDFALHLEFSTPVSNIRLTKYVYSDAHPYKVFDTLEEALLFVQRNHSDLEYIEQRTELLGNRQ